MLFPELFLDGVDVKCSDWLWPSIDVPSAKLSYDNVSYFAFGFIPTLRHGFNSSLYSKQSAYLGDCPAL